MRLSLALWTSKKAQHAHLNPCGIKWALPLQGITAMGLAAYPVGNAYTCDFLGFFHKDIILNDCRTENDEGKLVTIKC
jgi:hypothetical protein